jgi:hypothetical protein
VIFCSLEQFLSRQVLTALHNPRQPRIVHLHVVLLAGLASEMEVRGGPRDVDMPVTHGGEPKRMILTGILFVADSGLERRGPSPVNARAPVVEQVKALHEEAGLLPSEAFVAQMPT